jgi:hypothetical protein
MAIPNPEPGLVISYNYLWHREHEGGKREGRKTRPSVVVLSVTHEETGITNVIVLPVTHSPPFDPTAAVEIPAAIKKHLGLDRQRSWIVLSEGNEFLWPGYDLRKLPRSDRYAYGYLPPRFFQAVRDAFVAYYRTHKLHVAPRD